MNVNGYEIEHKYLIEMPIRDFFSGLECVKIYQTYLDSEVGVASRVRKMVHANGESEYYYTQKKDITAVTREESERAISPAEYQKLLQYNADSSRRTIQKTRYYAPLNGFIFEIDVFDFSQTKALMEVELVAEKVTPEAFPNVSIIRDVTNEKEFTNAAIAKCIPQEFFN